jgi:UDP-N-acetylmuramoyl-L-alanyl-D-glutamate--2,6-diaminopimelate ligase
VSDIVYRAQDARAGSCFVALKGVHNDGHAFVREAMRLGAAVVVSQMPMDIGGDATNVVVRNSRVVLGRMAARLYGDPSAAMTLIGVTGTNGKTTTTYVIESILRCAGMKPGVIGTVEYRYNDRTLPAPHTTPQSLDLQRLLANMREDGCDSCAMEVSSHALDQDRVAGVRYDVGVFTNLTPEHLDYHDGMDAYFNAKALLFERVLKEGGKRGATAVINIDDPYGAMLLARSAVPVMSFALDAAADVKGSEVVAGADGLALRIATPRGSIVVSSKLRGGFNAQNILAAAAAACAAGISLESIRTGIEALERVPGRFEAVDNERGVLALVDYSHKPDALTKALAFARALAKGSKLIAVFGCGGDRDRQKRPLMGRAAGTVADIVIVTSDNPRTESPESIIEEILPGVVDCMSPFEGDGGYEVIVDRRNAIARAVSLARAGDVIVVAGKGHEDYQILGTEKIHFDDREVLADMLKG